ncbi:MAG: OmpA family protein [Bacteroidetes bacterium]|nr:OmpA family protein [Bacteroidota bacterium]MBS1758170.1 OmpA family protein [Bacteroidota bacterium]
MKKIMLSVLALVAFSISFAQNDYKKAPGFAIHFTFDDFKTASEIRSTSISSVVNNKQWYKISRMDPGMAVSYLKGLTNHIDFVGTLTGSFTDDALPNNLSSGDQKFLLEAAATANFKLLTDRYYVDPFITAGVGASKYGGYFSAFLPVGVGLQVKLSDNVFVLLNSQYRIPVTEKAAYHFYHSIGIAETFGKTKVKAPVEVPMPVVLDRDNDGVVDSLDKCPDTPGIAALQGCPDRDGDGIADGDDKCPDVAGTAKYQGCPVPDTDGDGINDEMDKCPNVKGFARYQGCPIPDTDGDGVNDEEDKCPTRPGPATNQGCPVIAKEVVDKINYAAKNIFFATGSSKLLAKSYKSLNEVAKLLADDETLQLSIDGHTDNTGKADKNQTLSEARANAVKTYLASKGVADTRMTATGYGQDKPVADNKTAAGRAKNRRVEMTVKNY